MTLPALALLSAALDNSGYIAIRGFGNGKQARQKFFAPGDYQAACEEAMRLDGLGYDAYFATSTFLNTTSAKADNVNAVKCFKVDLDIDPNDAKKYPSKKAAVQAFLTFCQRRGIPAPVLIDSGYGVHAYLILSDALTPDDGKIYSEKFKSVLIAHHVLFDPTSTGDTARVLRVPGTHNYKQSVARAVALKSAVVQHDTDALLDTLDDLFGQVDTSTINAPSQVLGLGTLPAHLQGLEIDRTARSLLEGKPKSFQILISRTVGNLDKGCRQILDIYDRQGAQDEPRWRAGLSIAHFCEDGDKAIHDISNRHAAYDYDATVKKAQLLKGPYTCATFKSNWPAGCEGCPHNITSPIQLGQYVEHADKADSVVMAQNKLVDDAPVAYTIPDYPFPYFRAKGGGVYRKLDDDSDDGELVSKYDFYMVDRLRSESDGYLAQLRMHHPNDGVLDFTVETAALGSKDEFRKMLNYHGILTFDKEVFNMRSYVKRWYEFFETSSEVSMVRTQFGWVDNYAGFIIGDREVTAYHSNKFSRVAPSLAGVARFFQKKGDLAVWKKAFNVYGLRGFEPHALCALAGFGSPLMPLLKVHGALLNAYSQKSGTGKTTAQQAALSIWGDPEKLMLNKDDTKLAKFHRMGVHQNLPVVVDEVTKMSEDDISDFLLSSTSGRGRARMNASSNSERVNNTTWSAIVMSSSNTSFIEKLQADKSGVEGELMRLIEPVFPIQTVLTKAEADTIFPLFKENYGTAGEEYIKHVMADMNHTRQVLAEEQRAIDTTAVITGPERFWSAVGACILAGARLAQEVGLHDIDIGRVRQYYIDLIHDMRKRNGYTITVKANAEHKDIPQRTDLLGEFINAHSNGIVTVQVDDKGAITPIHVPVSRDIVARYERNRESLYVAQGAFRKFMRDRNANLDEYIETLKESGVYRGDGQCRLTRGTYIPSTPIRAYEFYMPDDSKLF